eukprot:417259-Amphidinium_carterae.1
MACVWSFSKVSASHADAKGSQLDQTKESLEKTEGSEKVSLGGCQMTGSFSVWRAAAWGMEVSTF